MPSQLPSNTVTEPRTGTPETPHNRRSEHMSIMESPGLRRSTSPKPGDLDHIFEGAPPVKPRREPRATRGTTPPAEPPSSASVPCGRSDQKPTKDRRMEPEPST